MGGLSVYILAFNQVKKIKAAIQSVLWADEVVVVDSYSTDGTVEIAQELGARVVQTRFSGFGRLRNDAIASCKHNWIFSLDSDERCTPEVREEVLALLRDPHALDIYYIPRKNFFMGRWIQHGGWYPDYRQPQLFKKGCLSYVDADLVHENYVCHTNKPCGYLKNSIWQIPFLDLSEMMEKANRYSTLSVLRLSQKRKGRVSMMTAFFHGGWEFIKHYVLQRGFLDGWPGFVISVGHGYGAFYRYAKYYESVQNWQLPTGIPSTDKTNRNYGANLNG